MADKQKQITVTIDDDVYNLMTQVADDIGQTLDQYVDDSLRVRLLRTASHYETRIANFSGRPTPTRGRRDAQRGGAGDFG